MFVLFKHFQSESAGCIIIISVTKDFENAVIEMSGVLICLKHVRMSFLLQGICCLNHTDMVDKHCPLHSPTLYLVIGDHSTMPSYHLGEKSLSKFCHIVSLTACLFLCKLLFKNYPANFYYLHSRPSLAHASDSEGHVPMNNLQSKSVNLVTEGQHKGR